MARKAASSTSRSTGPSAPVRNSAVRTSKGGQLDIDDLLADRKVDIIVCCGSGGVGKTTTAAALALRAAEQGRKVCVLTIDPARRLAQSMGLTELDNTPRPVKGVDVGAGGSLDAMMLDMKRTFDEVVQTAASPEKAKQILENPFYIALSSSFAGTQEYMAMEKLGQLHADPDSRWDLIVVDTPPSRSALDFLDAPERLSSLLDGRFMRLMVAPARGPARVLTAGLSLVTGAMTKILGGEFLTDVQAFIAALDTIFGGFRQRAEATYRLLQADETAFLVVAAPEPDAIREAAYFAERLTSERMPLAGLVVNRLHTLAGRSISAADAESGAQRLAHDGADEAATATAELLLVHAERVRRSLREEKVAARFTASHPKVPTVAVPALASDVHDLDGLRQIGGLLAGVAQPTAAAD
ncbi:MAG TPA: ArsA-related P-loop ATPase [Aeromicrobium sp.]|nr:ArsA-related P-loop ATPase [Aeromicrobium sp.]HKY59120.1 ArsA-related P-loop ATPase [Aeromicrobium sp.]